MVGYQTQSAPAGWLYSNESDLGSIVDRSYEATPAQTAIRAYRLKCADSLKKSVLK
jgi:hypothetical protein